MAEAAARTAAEAVTGAVVITNPVGKPNELSVEAAAASSSLSRKHKKFAVAVEEPYEANEYEANEAELQSRSSCQPS